MKFYEDETLEKIGYDFYCDIAINIVNKRKELGLTQGELAKKAKIRLSRLSRIEAVQYRIRLDEIECLAKTLDVTVNNLINSEIDSQVGDCLYLVYMENCENFKLYSRASSKRMAFLKLEKKLNDQRLTWFSTPRTRVFVKLVGVPVVKQELEDKLPRFKEDQEVEK
ncbi:helix-turn-helix domain-containing protein [Clostridium coskatii]|uniref:Helix-turn-helix protein n=1 Tax=Clostridium coskatii TaxID=1705578 RepID=A0A166RHE3_9CLOT|nr:helix-turn-helix transcriptional regulator [Clostridium coskatii]OAA90807.1 helix-turn-helix protein [Clostridium coskatii]OBR96841.1 helix-turn-helix protein [Clostridium coskatii]